MNEETTQKTIFDYATIITLSGVFLYQLGWVYWESYLRNLGINNSFIDIPIEKIISTTWTFVVLVLIGFSISIEQIFKLKDSDKVYILDNILIVLIGAIGLFILENKHFFKIIGIITFIVLFINKEIPVTIKNRIGIINRKQYLIFLGLFIFIYSQIYYHIQGAKDASKLVTDCKDDIEITLNHDNKTIKGKFIIFMNEKYFILITNRKNQRETLVLNDSEIYHTKFFNTK